MQAFNEFVRDHWDGTPDGLNKGQNYVVKRLEEEFERRIEEAKRLEDMGYLDEALAVRKQRKDLKKEWKDLQAKGENNFFALKNRFKRR